MESTLPVEESIRDAALNAAIVSLDQLLLPVLVLVCWTWLMWLWMLFTRIPAMQKARIHPDAARHTKDIAGKLPSNVRAVSDNYNHLHEQPTIFYALMGYIALTGGASQYVLYAAWAYVGLRVVHSLVQVLMTNVTMRFGLFVLSTMALFAMAGTQLVRLMG